MEYQEGRAVEIYAQANELLKEEFPEEAVVMQKKTDVREALDRLKDLASKRQNKLFEAHEIQRFFRETDKAISWINEKSIPLAVDDCGRDLVSVQSLQRKHEALERDLTALEEKTSQLSVDADTLSDKHPDSRDTIQDKKNTLLTAWQELKDKCVDRRNKLEESFLLHRFLSDWRDLTLWISDTKAIISADDLAKDVTGAEAHVERHNEHKGEIDSREDAYKACMEEGQHLVDLGHPTSADVVQKMNTLQRERDFLLDLWESRRIQFEQCMDLMLFFRDAEQAEAWIAKQEAFLENKDVGDSLDAAEALMRKQEDFEKSLSAQEEKIKNLEAFADKLIAGNHYASPEVAERRESLLRRRTALQDKAARRHQQLEDSHRYQMFDRDADEIQAWIAEKLKTATDESYKDPTNLQTKVQKHLNFESEINANRSRLDEVKKMGSDLVDAEHSKSGDIQARIDELDALWAQLVDAMHKKGKNLEQANNQQQFVRNIEDVELWLSEVEAQVTSEDRGRDLNNVVNIQKKHNLLESDVHSHRDRITAFQDQVEKFKAEQHFDAPILEQKQQQVMARYSALTDPLKTKRARLDDAYKLHQFYRDVEDEEDWIREKEPVAGSSNLGESWVAMEGGWALSVSACDVRSTPDKSMFSAFLATSKNTFCYLSLTTNLVLDAILQ